MNGERRNCRLCNSEFITGRGNGGGFYCKVECRKQMRSIKSKDKREKALATGTIHGRPLYLEIYNRYVRGAVKRNKSFHLSIEEFRRFWKNKCHYCGDQIQTIGIDRVDNNKGYQIDNIVACCTECNLMKRGMSGNSFIFHCKKVSKNINI